MKLYCNRFGNSDQVCVSKTPESISDLKNCFTRRKFITKNSISDSSESKNILSSKRLRNRIELVCTTNNRQSFGKR